MKLFAVGNYDKFSVYALVMAETPEEAILKIKNLKAGDIVGVNDVLDNIDIERHCIKYILDAADKVKEVPSGIYIAENS